MALRALAAAILGLATAGCFSESKLPDKERVHADVGFVTARFAAIAAPLAPGGGGGGLGNACLAEAVSDLSAEPALDFVFLIGDLIPNEKRDALERDVGALASTAGILAARTFAVVGPRARTGAATPDEVFEALERAKLVPVRAGYYSEAIRPGVRVMVLDSTAASKPQLEWLRDALREAKEEVIVAAAHAADPKLAEILAVHSCVRALVVANDPAAPGAARRPPIVVVPPLAERSAYVVATVDPRNPPEVDLRRAQ